MTTRAVLFDLGDTVIHIGPWPADFPTRLGHFLREHAEAGDLDHHAVAANLHTSINGELMKRFETGDTSEDDLGEMVIRHSSNIDVLLRTAAGDAGRRLYGEADTERFVLPDGRHELLDTFRSRGLKLAIVSNTSTPRDMMESWLAEAGLAQYFDALIFSSALGLRKPHPAIFETALAAVGAEPGESVYIGDRVREDVKGPGTIGMRGILTHEFRQEAHNGEPFAVVETLAELGYVLDLDTPDARLDRTIR